MSYIGLEKFQIYIEMLWSVGTNVYNENRIRDTYDVWLTLTSVDSTAYTVNDGRFREHNCVYIIDSLCADFYVWIWLFAY